MNENIRIVAIAFVIAFMIMTAFTIIDLHIDFTGEYSRVCDKLGGKLGYSGSIYWCKLPNGTRINLEERIEGNNP